MSMPVHLLPLTWATGRVPIFIAHETRMLHQKAGESLLNGSRMQTVWIENKSILTPTSGFLASGYTHTINPYVGCAFARSTCGTFCYAQHNQWITQGRPWGLFGAKRHLIA